MILVKLINDATAHGLYAGEVAAFEDAVAERMIKLGRGVRFEAEEEAPAKVVAHPKADKAEPEPESEPEPSSAPLSSIELDDDDNGDAPVKRGPGRPRKYG
jgi:hypothetical protein